jgi:hypothetical protein
MNDNLKIITKGVNNRFWYSWEIDRLNINKFMMEGDKGIDNWARYLVPWGPLS